MSEEEIVHDYSQKYKFKEDYFRSTIFPQIRDLRREDGRIKEYETYINGRMKVAWQWAGY